MNFYLQIERYQQHEKDKKKGLGRGLSALFGNENTEVKTNEKNTNNHSKALIGNLTSNPHINQGRFSTKKN